MPNNGGPNGVAASLRAFAALAILKVNWDEHRDYIGNFVPLVAHCIREAGAEAVSVSDAQEQIQATFGIRIPQGPLKTILGRASRDGLITREHHVYRPNHEALEGSSLRPAQESVLRQHAHLVHRLIGFAEKRGRSWSEDQAERALLAYVEVLAEPILGAAIEGEPVVDLPHIDGEGSAVVIQFVLDLCSHEPEAFDYLETIVKGSMLANVLYFPEAFGGGKPQLGRIDIYLDTPVALRVLGYAEEHFRAPVMELVVLLREQGASLKMFDHTLREVEGVLDGAASNYRTGRVGEFPGDVVDYFASENLSASDVQVVIATIEDRLESNDIEVVAAPDQSEKLAVDETQLEQVLSREVGYKRREALLRDLDSITAIHRIRRGEVRRRIERCEALVVTTNVPLVRASRIFFERVHGGSDVPVCVLDSRLAAIAWLMNPAQASDLPRKQIIATSYAALNPSEVVWRKYLTEIRNLAEKGELSEEQVGLLVFSPEARLSLMNATDGRAEAFTEGTVPEILEHARRAAQAAVVTELEREKELRQKAEAEIAAERQRTNLAVSQATAVAEAHTGHLSATSHRVARFAGWAVFSLALAAVVAGTGFATSDLFPESWSNAVPFASALVIGAVVIGIWSVAFGGTLKDLARAVERLLQPRIERRLRRWLTPPSEDSAEES